MKDLNPVTVLKTAIQLHQRQPRGESHLGASSTATVTSFSPHLPVPTQQHPRDFTHKLENLQKVLPFANEVKLASLLAGAQGDMVVQEILDSSNNPEVEDEREGVRIIDLTDNNDKKCLTEARIKQLASNAN